MKITKERITMWEVIARIITMILVFIISYFIKDSDRQYLSVLGLLVAFFCSIYLHRHFFPFLTAAITCFLLGSVQELWNASYVYLPVTRFLWVSGNILLPIGIIDFMLKLIFKYKIVENDHKTL